MKIEKKVYERELSPKAVDEFSKIIRNFLTSLKLSKQDVTRHSISAEEILLDYLDQKEEGKKIKLTIGKKLFSPFFSLEVDGNPKNVFIKNKDDHSFLGDTILTNLNLSPDYNYTNDKNEYSFKIKGKKLNPFLVMLIAISSSILVGIIGNFFPTYIKESITENFIVPVCDTFIDILSCIAGPMIFLSVAWGIYGIGDVATLKRIGKRIFLGDILTMFLIVAISAFICIPIFNWNYTVSSDTGSEFSAILNMILDIFPSNIVSPFYDGNTLQIICLAFIIGIALIFLGKKTTSVARAIEQINYIIQFLTEIITKLVPFFIFTVLLKMIWTSTLDSFLNVWKIFASFIGLILLTSIVMIIYTAINNKTNAINLFKKGVPILLIAMTTASSAAAFATNVKVTHDEFGVDKSVTAFSIPLGMVLFKVATALGYLTLAFYFSESYQIDFSIMTFVTIIITSVILSMATPPIPGGATVAYTILLTQLFVGLANSDVLLNEALAITIACDVFIDFIATGFDQFILPYALINQAKKLDLIDLNLLKGKKTKIKKSV